MAHVLVVEDSPEMASLIALTTRMEGHITSVATTGEEALHMVRAEPPDLILLDVMLEGMDGFQVAQQLKSEEETRSIPIIFVTARGELEDRILGLSLGIDYVVKPFAVAELLARVGAALRR